jgi:hypothetical protein
MILNAYAVLDAFFLLLRLGAGLLLIGLAAAAVRQAWGPEPTPEGRQRLEDRCYLLALVGLLAGVLNVASWPVFYLLLESYIPEWPGVMCVYGVTQVGRGSLGVSRFLPDLVRAVQVTKPVLVFLSGAWLVLYLLNRRTRTAPLTGRVLLLVLGLGVLAVSDATLEAAYVVIPKKEELPPLGCCTVAFRDGSRFAPEVLVGEEGRPWLYAAYYAVNGAMILALFAWPRLRRGAAAGRRAWLLALPAALSLAVNGLFLTEVAAPLLLDMPSHHCPYDLLPKAPESLPAVFLFVLGGFAVGWAGVASWLGASRETEASLPPLVRRLLSLALSCYLASVGLMSLELALASRRGGSAAEVQESLRPGWGGHKPEALALRACGRLPYGSFRSSSATSTGRPPFGTGSFSVHSTPWATRRR